MKMIILAANYACTQADNFSPRTRAVVSCETFRDSPASTTSLTHRQLTLSCYAPDPSPPPSVVWLHNEIFQASTGRISVSYDNGTGRSEFQIREVAYGDAGDYRCLALDEEGAIMFQSHVGTLTVLGELVADVYTQSDSLLPGTNT